MATRTSAAVIGVIAMALRARGLDIGHDTSGQSGCRERYTCCQWYAREDAPPEASSVCIATASIQNEVVEKEVRIYAAEDFFLKVLPDETFTAGYWALAFDCSSNSEHHSRHGSSPNDMFKEDYMMREKVAIMRSSSSIKSDEDYMMREKKAIMPSSSSIKSDEDIHQVPGQLNVDIPKKRLRKEFPGSITLTAELQELVLTPKSKRPPGVARGVWDTVQVRYQLTYKKQDQPAMDELCNKIHAEVKGWNGDGLMNLWKIDENDGERMESWLVPPVWDEEYGRPVLHFEENFAHFAGMVAEHVAALTRTRSPGGQGQAGIAD